MEWLLDGDVSVQYQVHRDLLGEERPDLRARIEHEGWGQRFLSLQNPDGHWGRAYYSPKWTSTHYTVLDLKNLGINPEQPSVQSVLAQILRTKKGKDGGINPAVTRDDSDVCLSGMFLNFGAYFRIPERDLASIVDFILQQQMSDGGFNCDFNQRGAVHSSLHTSISVLEGILEYIRNGYSYRASDLRAVEAPVREFILMHRLYRSDRTGEVINKRFLLLSYPSRWFYDILRALDYFQDAGVPDDPRMQDALDVLASKRRSDGRWLVQGKHAGQLHFEMELTGKPSRWNTLRALRVFKHFEAS